MSRAAETPRVESLARPLVCPNCRARLDFTTNGWGQSYAVCRTCGFDDRQPIEAQQLPTVIRVPTRNGAAAAPAAERVVRVVELPAVAPGQLRCQVCAKGVTGRGRFCPVCLRERLSRGGRKGRTRPAPGTACLDCGQAYQPARPSSPRCVACTRARRSKGQRALWQQGRAFREKPCATCGASFTPKGPHTRHCEAHRRRTTGRAA